MRRAMPSLLDRALISHVAQLSSLSLTDAEAEKLTHELAAIVKYVSELETLDTSNVPPTAHVQDGEQARSATRSTPEARAALRADEVIPGLSHEDALSQAPRVAAGGFAVPPFVDSGSGSGE